MPTRLDLRLSLRQKLEDTGVSPLWADPVLNEMLWNALVRFSARVPLEVVLSQSIPAATTAIPITPSLTRDRILRVFDGNGQQVPEAQSADLAQSGEALTWRWWNGTLRLNRELSFAETWTIEYRAVRTMPSDDVTEIEIQPEDAPVVIALAAEAVMRRRAIEEVKRTGHAAGVIAVADLFAAEAQSMLRDRNRTVRSGVLIGTN